MHPNKRMKEMSFFMLLDFRLSFRAKRIRVVEPKAKNLENINVDAIEILPPYGRLNDNYEGFIQ